MRIIVSAFVGAVLGIAATFIHNLWPPMGLIVAIAGTFLGIRLLGQLYFERTVKVVATLAWILVVMRASSLGNGDELLITGLPIGSYFVAGGFISALIALSVKP